MRVMWWLGEYPPDPGGISTFAAVTRAALVDRGVDLDLLVVARGDSDTTDGTTRITRRPILESVLANDVAAIARWVAFVSAHKRDVSPDAYHLHLSDASPLLHLMTRATSPAPTILTLHSEVFKVVSRTDPDSLFGRVLDMSAVITAVSAGAADALVARRPDLADRVVVVPNGVPIGTAPTPPPLEPRLLIAGRLVPEKGVDRVLRALPEVLALVPRATLTVAGDGPEASSLARLAESLGVGGAVTWLGHIDRASVRSAMDQHRIVVMASRREGMPMAALEAAERGRCLVATDLGGMREVVMSERTGLLVDEASADDDPTPLVGALVRGLTEPGLAERMGDAARVHAEGHFAVERTASLYEDVYRAVSVGERRPRVSVIMPVWNGARHVRFAVDSVLAQTYGDLELIVVDDGSDDESLRVVDEVDDQRIVLLPQPHRGKAASRNAALALARGDLIAHLDHDDTWPADRLACLVGVLDARPDIVACFGSVVQFRDFDAPTNSVVRTEPAMARTPTTGVIRAEAHRQVGPFRNLDYGDGLDWAMRMVAIGLPLEQIDQVVLHRRVHATNSSHSHPFALEKGRVAILKAALDLRRNAT